MTRMRIMLTLFLLLPVVLFIIAVASEGPPDKFVPTPAPPAPVQDDVQALRGGCHYWHEQYQNRRPSDLTFEEDARFW